MTPIDASGRWYNAPEAFPAADLASAARGIGTASSTAFDVSGAEKLISTLSVTNINGGTVALTLEVSVDGTNWDSAGAFPTKSANGTHRRAFDVGYATQARWTWTVATATVTFATNTSERTVGR